MISSTATTTFEQHDDVLTVKVTGDIDDYTVPDLLSAIISRVGADERTVRLDLSAVTFCSSAGIGLFVGIQRHVEKQGGEMTIVKPTQITKAMLAVCGVNGLLRIEPDLLEPDRVEPDAEH